MHGPCSLRAPSFDSDSAAARRTKSPKAHGLYSKFLSTKSSREVSHSCTVTVLLASALSAMSAPGAQKLLPSGSTFKSLSTAGTLPCRRSAASAASSRPAHLICSTAPRADGADVPPAALIMVVGFGALDGASNKSRCG